MGIGKAPPIGAADTDVTPVKNKLGFHFTLFSITGCEKSIRPPHTKVNFSYNKRLNLTTKFGVLGFLGIVNLQKKFGGSISKIVDFSLMSNFC